MSFVALDQVSRHWGPTKAVDNISFVAEAGRFLVLLGPSGCGKSTTLRLIAGLETATAGTIRIGDRDVTHLPPAKRKLSMVFQSYALFPHLSVRENVLFGLKIRKVTPDEQKRRLDRVGELLGLAPLLERKPSQLSGGQQQRVALARALVAETSLCLMDEPLSNLDAKLRHEMRQEIRGLQQRLGITMIYVTHDQTEAMSMADRIILMHGGRIEQNASPDELYQYPATSFAAGFIGTPPMNLVPTEAVAGGTTILGCGAAGQAVPVSGAPAPGLLLGVRPENIRLLPQGAAEACDHAAHSPTPPLCARVQTVDYFGADSIVDCRVGSEILKIRVNGHYRIEGDGEVQLLLPPPAQIHGFDPQTTQRVGIV